MTPNAPHLTVARGARLAEEAALAAIDALLDGGSASLDAPVYLVVPSQSLRLHLMGRLVETAGRSRLGIRCQTHFGLALRVLDALDEIAPRGLDLFPILARRFARREDDLIAALDHLREGYNGILPAVRDLLDAGFDPAHLEAIEEALTEEDDIPASSEEIARARALARVTARTRTAFDELGVGRTSTLFQAATGGIRRDPDRALPTRGIVLHGFADATGVTTDFLTTLIETYGGTVVIDRPADPVRPGREDPAAQFTERLTESFGTPRRARRDPSQPAASQPAESQPLKSQSSETQSAETQSAASESAPPEIALFRALGEEAEVREVAQRSLDLIESGARPESIGIVMREPRAYRTVVRRLFDELTLPFSTHGLEAPIGPAERRIRAWIEILARGSRCHVERWLDATPSRIEGVALFDLRVAFAALGISRIEQLAGLDLKDLLLGDSYPLPVRQGFFEAAEEAEDRTVVRSARRRVSAQALEAAVEAGRSLARSLDDWPGDPLSLDRHVDHLRRSVVPLGWTRDSRESRYLDDLLRTLLEAPPVAVDRDELVLTVRRLARELARKPLGGRGGGVQVMGVVEARGLTFDHLFVLGMNRGTFPRTVREDPVLSDALRKRLARGGHGLLPDLPIKWRGYQEERYLFAQLLSCAPFVTLSWLDSDDEDRPLAPSPLIERLRWGHGSEAAGWRDAPLVGRRAILDLHGDSEISARRLGRLPDRERLVLAALEGERSALPDLFSVALGHGAEPSLSVDWHRVGQARSAVVEELDPTDRTAGESCLSPYFGFVGPVVARGDPRADERLYVTTVERLATCPWQTFLERLLRVEAVPDPLEALPRIDALMIGIVVHRVLERIVASALSPESSHLSDRLESDPVSVSWPQEETLEAILAEQAEVTVRAAGVALAGFPRALVAVARPYLEVARRIEWSGGTIETLGAEVDGSLVVRSHSGSRREIAFRADRVDRDDEGWALIDYKTGSSPYTQRKPASRYQRYLADIATGARLQPAVYAAATAELAADPAAVRGRFSFLRPDLDTPAEARWVTVSGTDSDLRQRLDDVLGIALETWERGLFFPRLELPEGIGKAPPACQWCRVAEACLRQDSGSRRRLRLGMEHLRSGRRGVGSEELGRAARRALLEQWWLAAPDQRPDDLDRVLAGEAGPEPPEEPS